MKYTGNTSETLSVLNKKALDDKIKTQVISLPVDGWTDDSIDVACSGVTTSNDVVVAPAPASFDEYVDCEIRCTAQSTDTLTFGRVSANSSALSVNVMIIS